MSFEELSATNEQISEAEQLTEAEMERRASLGKVAANMQSFEIGEGEVTQYSPYYKGGEVTIPFHKIYGGGAIYRQLKAEGIERGGRQ